MSDGELEVGRGSFPSFFDRLRVGEEGSVLVRLGERDGSIERWEGELHKEFGDEEEGGRDGREVGDDLGEEGGREVERESIGCRG